MARVSPFFAVHGKVAGWHCPVPHLGAAPFSGLHRPRHIWVCLPLFTSLGLPTKGLMSLPCWKTEVMLAWTLPQRTAWQTRGHAAAPCKGGMRFTRAHRSPSALPPLGVAAGAYRQAGFRPWFLCHLLAIAQFLIYIFCLNYCTHDVGDWARTD